MLVQIGPLGSAEIDGWLRFVRRVMCDIRTEPGDMDSADAHTQALVWNALVDSWDEHLGDVELGQDFLWREELDADRAEYLLYVLHKAIESETLAIGVTPEDISDHGPVTVHIAQRFLDSLEGEGRAQAEYVEMVRNTIVRYSARF